MVLRAKLKIVIVMISVLVCGNALAVEHGVGYKPDTVQQIKLYFRFSESVLKEDYRENAISITELNKILGGPAIDSISIVSTASPEGVLEYNKLIAGKRSQAVYEFILAKHPTLNPSIIATSGQVNSWSKLLSMIEDDLSLPHKKQVIDVINRPASLATTEWRLKQIGSGAAWKYIERHYLKHLRAGCVDIMIHLNNRVPSDHRLNSDTTQIHLESKLASLADNTPIPIGTVIDPFKIYLSINSQSPQTISRSKHQIALKINLLELAAGIANIGVEFGLGKHLSLDLPFAYSPYTIAPNYRLRTVAFRPELKYWFSDAFDGHFIGLHAIGGIYNVSVNSDTRYQSNRMAYGIGLSYGYAFRLSKHWGVELSLGAGYVNTSYDCYYNVPNGMMYDSRNKHYWGITRASVGIVYLINCKR